MIWLSFCGYVYAVPLGPRFSAARQPVTNHESQSAPGRDSNRLVKLLPASREKLVEKGAIEPEHHCRRAHRPARASRDRFRGGRVMLLSQQSQVAADIGKRWLCQHPARRSCEYAVRLQQLARQVQPVSLRIFGEIAKYVGELQRPAEFCCNPPARRRRLAKNPHRDPADRDCHALAIAVELLEVKRSGRLAPQRLQSFFLIRSPTYSLGRIRRSNLRLLRVTT
jgi:hypothetical protein